MAAAPVKPFKPMVFSNTKPPCPMKDPLSFEEPDFNEFQKQYIQSIQRRKKRKGL
jgi:hypothetical protein